MPALPKLLTGRSSCFKILAGLLFSVALAVTGALMLVPHLLNPESYRARILSASQQALHRPVSYESASISWELVPTIVVRGITVAEKSGDGALLKLDRLTFRLALLPLLHKELRLREIVAERPLIVLDRNKAGVFSMDDLFTGPPSGFRISLDTLRIHNGLIRFTDRAIDPAGFSTSLENVELTVNGLERGGTSRFTFSGRVPDGNGQADLAFSGTARIPAAGGSRDDTHLDLKLSAANLNAGRYWPYYGRWLPFERLRGVLNIEQTFRGTPQQFSAKGQIRVSELRFNYPRAFTAPLTPRAVQLAYDLELTPRDLALKSFDLNVDGLRVTGSCVLGDIHTSDLHINARAATSPFRLEEFNRYIPYGIIPTGTGNFIREHITAGVFRLDEGRLEGRLSRIAHMERGDNSNVLLIRGSVEKGLVSFGPRVPAFSNVRGGLEMRGKDFSLRGMSGTFGASPFTLDGKIADYPLAQQVNYPFSMTIVPSPAEVGWLLHQNIPAAASFNGPSTLNLTGSGPAADYRLAGTWDLSGADYRYRELLRKPAGVSNTLRFTARLGSTHAELTDFHYQLPPLDITANAGYLYNADNPLTFAVSTNRFMLPPDQPFAPLLRNYHPAGGLQARISGSGDPARPDSIGLSGDVTLTDVSLQATKQIKPLSGINGTIHLTESSLTAKRLSGRIGNSPFQVSGRVAGRASPVVELAFSSPLLHPEDFGLVSAEPAPEFKDLAGVVSLKDMTLTITSLSGQTADTKFNLSGELAAGGTPRMTLRADFPHLVLEDLLPLARLKRAGNRAGQPGGLTLKARITSATGSFGGIPFRQLDSELTLNNDLLAIQTLGIGLFGGSATGSGQADFGAAGGPAYQAHYTLDGIAADQLLRAVGAKPYLSGQLGAAGELTARGETGTELLKSTQASASLHLPGGTLSITPSGESAGEKIPYRDLDTKIALKGGALAIQGLKAAVFGGTMTGSGTADFSTSGTSGFQGSYRLDNVAADQLLRAAGAKPYLSGPLTMEGKLAVRGTTGEELKKNGQITADIVLADGVMNTPAISGLKATTAFPFKKLQTRLTLKAGKLDLDSILMDVFGGVVSGNFGADFSAPDGPAHRISCRLDNVDADALFHAFDVTKELTGRMNLQTELSARGESADALRKTVQGTLSTRLVKGVVKKYGFVSKVLSLLNVSQLVDFRVPDLTSSGMPYDEIHGNFEFNNGTVTTSDLSIHSPSLNMTMVGNADLVSRELDVKIGVQPFQTFGRVVARIPVLGWILTGGEKRVVVVYYEAKGPFGDPKISGTSMANLPGGVYNIFKRTFNLPENLISQPGTVIMGN